MAEGKSIGSLLIKITADSVGLRTGIKQSQEQLKSFERSLSALKVGLLSAFSVGAITAFAKKSYAAYEIQLKNEQLLLTALKGRKDVQERLLDQANTLQDRTLFNDEDIINNQKLLASLGLTEQQIRMVTGASVQLATALGIGLNTASEMLAKTFQGGTRELGRLIPAIKTMTKDQLANGSAIDWVNNNMKGLAETAANTDPIAKMSQQWGEFGELMGSLVAPAVNKTLTGLNSLLRQVTSKDLTLSEKLLAAMPTINGGMWRARNAMVMGINQNQREAENSAIADNTAKFNDNAKAVENVVSAREKLRTELQKMAKDMQGPFSAPYQFDSQSWNYSPGSLPGKVGAGVGADGQLNNNMPVLNFPEYKKRWEETYKGYQDFAAKMQDTSKQMTAIINQGITDMAVGIADAFGTMIATGKSFNPSGLLDGLASMMSQLGKLAILTGVTTLAIRTSLKSLNGYAAIGAGMALVALAAAVKAGASNLANGASTSTAATSSSSSGGSSSDYYFNRNLGDTRPITIKVIGKISGEDIRLANERATAKHINGY